LAVLIEAISVIVKVSVLEKKYPGGALGYSEDSPNKTHCTDGRLTRIGFMCPTDAELFIERLGRHGLTAPDAGGLTDIVVIDQTAAAPTIPCEWIEVGEFANGVLGAWTIDPADIPGELFVPQSWDFENSLSQKPGYVAAADQAEKFTYVGNDGARDVYIDRETGKQVYVGRTSPEARPADLDDETGDTNLTPIVATIAWAKAVNLLDPSRVANLLAENVKVSFQWSFDDFEGRDAYLSYLDEKFARVGKGKSPARAEIAETGAYTFGTAKLRPCVVAHQDGELAATVILTVEDNKIERVDYCIIPPPQTCKRSGLFPGLILLDEDSAKHAPSIFHGQDPTNDQELN
jgi:ketosteroid isomerase-like protein